MGGTSYTICCTECGYRKKILAGIFMLVFPENADGPEYALAVLTSQIKSEVLREHARRLVLERNARLEDGFGRYPYRCPACGEFYVQFDFRLVYSGGDYSPYHVCPRCRSPLEQVDLDSDVFHPADPPVLAAFPCPRCKKRTLKIDNSVIQWD